MPFPRPQFDQYPWDGPLVNHMAQLMDPAVGGINYWTTRPTLGVDGATLSASHVGFTGYNATTETFERWDGTTWCELGSGGSIPVWTTATRPTAPEANDLGFNTTLNKFEMFDGEGWMPIESGLPTWTTETRPNPPVTNQVGLNTTTGELERHNGTTWVSVAGGSKFPMWGDSTRPSNPQVGDTGFNTERNALEMWDGSEWEYLSGSLPLLPESNPETGDQYFDTVNRVPRIWDGTKWMPTAPITSATQPTNVPDNSMWLDTSFEPPILKLKTPEGWETISSEGEPVIDPAFDWDTVTATVTATTLDTTTPQYIKIGAGNPTVTLPASPPAGMTVYLSATDPQNTASIAFNGKTYGGSGDRRKYTGTLGVVKMEYVGGVWTSTPLMPLVPTNSAITNPIISQYFGGSNTAHINYVVDNMVAEGLWSKFDSSSLFYDFRPAELAQDKTFNWVDPSRYKLVGASAYYNSYGMTISDIPPTGQLNIGPSLFEEGGERCLVIKIGQSGHVHFGPKNIRIYTPGRMEVDGNAAYSLDSYISRLYFGAYATAWAAFGNTAQGQGWYRYGFFINSTHADTLPRTITDAQVDHPTFFPETTQSSYTCLYQYSGCLSRQPGWAPGTYFLNNSGGYISAYYVLEGVATPVTWINAIATPTLYSGIARIAFMSNVQSIAVCSSFTSLAQMSTYAQILDNAPLAS